MPRLRMLHKNIVTLIGSNESVKNIGFRIGCVCDFYAFLSTIVISVIAVMNTKNVLLST